jgi:hypothetical protein
MQTTVDKAEGEEEGEEEEVAEISVSLYSKG